MPFQENRFENILTVKIGQLTRQNIFLCDLIFVTSNYFILKDNTVSFNLKFCLNGRLKPRHSLAIKKFLLLFEFKRKRRKISAFLCALKVKSGTCRKYKIYINKSRQEKWYNLSADLFWQGSHAILTSFFLVSEEFTLYLKSSPNLS